VLSKDGYEVDAVNSAEAALKNLEEAAYDLVITDITLRD